MDAQLYFEDIEVGMDVPPLAVTPSTTQLVMWAAGSGDFNPLHFDQDFARGTGLSGVIVHGKLKAALLIQMITDWIGDQGTVRKMSVRYREMDYPGQQMTCRAKVTAKEPRDGENWVECDAWIENPRGQQATTGSFGFTLPSRQ